MSARTGTARGVSITPGVDKASAPSEDRLEETWLSYYASIFNPARLKIKAMQAEMPKKYWKNLPEAKLIAPLIAKSGQSTTAMIADAATDAKPTPQRREPAMPKIQIAPSGSLEALRDEAAECRACPLWEDATQTRVRRRTADGPADDGGRATRRQGRPRRASRSSARPGQMLDRALKEAGIDRGLVYVTNAVKHFKFVPRGKIRLHQKPNVSELKACRPWYQRERDAIAPDLVVALGATAAHGVLGKATPVNANRGRLIDLDDGGRALITVHPSYLLRLPDEDAKLREYARFVEDFEDRGRGLECCDGSLTFWSPVKRRYTDAVRSLAS